MNVLLCGVRGSRPAPGFDFCEVGGHTSCVAIEAPGGRHLVLDAGTGFTRLTDELADRPLRGSVLLTHLHWDHVHGLPFLPNADRDDAEVDLYVPLQGGIDAHDLLARSMSPPHFPIEPSGLHGAWNFHSIDAGPSTVEGFGIVAAEIAHKGGRTFGYRVTDATGSLAYLPDHAPRIATGAELDGALAIAAGVDVLLHGGQFVEAERQMADAFGHATIDDALAFADQAGVGRVVLLHHSPVRTDAAVASFGESVGDERRPVTFGREGDRVVI